MYIITHIHIGYIQNMNGEWASFIYIYILEYIELNIKTGPVFVSISLCVIHVFVLGKSLQYFAFKNNGVQAWD